jgi:hypothetical protein
MSNADESVCFPQRFQVLFAQEGASVGAKSILRMSAAKLPLFAFREELARRFQERLGDTSRLPVLRPGSQNYGGSISG